MFATFSMTEAVRSTRRPAAKIAALAATLFFACCIARSDAQVALDSHAPFDASKVVGSWYARDASAGAQPAFADAQTRGVVASAETLLTTPKIDGFSGEPAHVSALRVISETRMHRVGFTVRPEIRFTPHLGPGQRRTVRTGTSGVAWVTERVTLWNDVPVGRQELAREVIRSAKPAVQLQGTPRTLAQLRSMTSYRSVETALTMVATAYTADTATAFPTGYTATGVVARQGIVAVDPHVIPLGSLVFVPGYGIAVAADTGGAIVGHRIDLCMDSYDEAVNFGRQTVQVYLLKR